MSGRLSRSRTAAVLALAAGLAAVPVASQEFGFGDAQEAAGAVDGEARAGLRVGGEIEFGTTLLFDSLDDLADMTLSSLACGRLDFEASGSSVDAALKLRISEQTLDAWPESFVDEAFVRIYLGPVDLEGGLLKVAWGRADSQGPLDVLNPDDLTDLTVTDERERKIARPMLRASVAMGERSRLEAVFAAGFEGHRIAWDGPWAPLAVRDLKAAVAALGVDPTDPQRVLDTPDTESLGWAHGGLRFTTTLGAADLGGQLFSGYLPTPVVASDLASMLALAGGTPLPVSYDRYYQAGADFAAVVGGLNLRAELAANVTEDLCGDDPDVTNPAIAWSLGFDRDLFAGVNLNLQAHGTCRLLESRVGNEAYDIEAGTDRTRSRITAVLSQKLLKDTVEWQLRALVGIEDRDFLLMPTVGLVVGDARVDLAAGIFGGDEQGELGQYADSSYMRLSLSYRF